MATRPAPVPDREHAPRRDGAQAPPLPPATTLPRPADRRLVGSRAPPVLPRSRPAATPPSRPERRADRPAAAAATPAPGEIGRASCRERVKISEGAET